MNLLIFKTMTTLKNTFQLKIHALNVYLQK